MTDQDTIALTEDELSELIAGYIVPHLEDWYRQGWEAGFAAGQQASSDTCPPPPTFAQLLDMQRRGTLRG